MEQSPPYAELGSFPTLFLQDNSPIPVLLIQFIIVVLVKRKYIIVSTYLYCSTIAMGAFVSAGMTSTPGMFLVVLLVR